MLRDFYTYKVIHKDTGDYYIGIRTKPMNCKLGENWYLIDNYWGSQVGWKEVKGLNKKQKSEILQKQILNVYYQTTQKQVAIIESEIIKFHYDDPLNKNYHYDYSGGFSIGHKNPSKKRKNTRYTHTSIVFYKDAPYRLCDIRKKLNLSFEDTLNRIELNLIIPVNEYLKGNILNHTKQLKIYDEIKTVLYWSKDERLNPRDFLYSTKLLMWHLNKNKIQYQHLSKEEISKIRSSSQIGIKKPGTSLYAKNSNPSKRQDVKDKISEKNKKPKKKKLCPHCEKLVTSSRFHFDNCKHKKENENINRKVGSYTKKRNIIECPFCKKLCIGKNKWHFGNCKSLTIE